MGSRERGGEQPTQSLLDEIRLGSDDARNELVARYLEPLIRWARLRCSNDCEPAVIEQLVRQSLHEIIDHFSRLPPSERGAFHWRLREAVQRRATRTTLRGSTSSPLAAAVSDTDLARYDEALRQLNDAEKEIVITRIELGFSPDQIAGLLGASGVDKIEAATGRALVNLAWLIGDDEARAERRRAP